MSADPRYPIGPFTPPTTPDLARWLEEIAAAPRALREAVRGLDEKQLATPYREGGWTVRQVVHHVPDSHVNAYVRTKLVLTETRPTVKPYLEAAWAELADSRTTPIDVSLAILEHVHARWLHVLRAIGPADLERTYFHPEQGKTFTLAHMLALYAWHGRHHVAHVTTLRQRLRW